MFLVRNVIKNFVKMNYNELYNVLKDRFSSKGEFEHVEELNLTIETQYFNSQRADLLFGSPMHSCEKHKDAFELSQDSTFVSYGLDEVELRDYEIECNKRFEYYILKCADISQAEGAIIFFHGLNEKKWDKYLPWAYEFAQRTKKAVILFPIAFHMNRADERWSDRRLMERVSKFRREKFSDNTDSSFVNAATSSRLESHPQRIFWSGFQTYSDVISLVNSIREGEVRSISSDSGFDLFGYSIGSFLSVIIKMADPHGIFKDSKLFCFCGGMTIDRMFPISKYIMDSRSTIRMQTVFAELLSSNFTGDKRLAHFQNESLHGQESWFKTMLRYNYYQKEREERIKELELQLKAYVLMKDEVAPPVEAMNTLQGGYRDIKVDVEIQDFSFDYTHVVPFPLGNKDKEEVTKGFQHFVNSASEFYMK